MRRAVRAPGPLAREARWTWRWQSGFKPVRFGLGQGPLTEPDAVRLLDAMWLALE